MHRESLAHSEPGTLEANNILIDRISRRRTRLDAQDGLKAKASRILQIGGAQLGWGALGLPLTGGVILARHSFSPVPSQEMDEEGCHLGSDIGTKICSAPPFESWKELFQGPPGL